MTVPSDSSSSPIPPLDPITRLTRDVRNAALTLTPHEARFLVASYYALQDYRIATSNQTIALTKAGKPHETLGWYLANMRGLENEMKKALDTWTSDKPTSIWARGIKGIGPVLSAGLLAHIDMEKCPTVGHIWRFAGIDPSRVWTSRDDARKMVADAISSAKSIHAAVGILAGLIHIDPVLLLRMATTNPKGGEVKLTPASLAKAASRRPWNAGLKTLCWKIGESIIKAGVKKPGENLYGELYYQRKAWEQERNLRGVYSDLAKVRATKVGTHTLAYGWYTGKHTKGLPVLSPGHVHARARRYSVKIFLSHYHAVAHWYTFGTKAPTPYVIEFGGHAHLLEVPNFHFDREGVVITATQREKQRALYEEQKRRLAEAQAAAAKAKAEAEAKAESIDGDVDLDVDLDDGDDYDGEE